MKKLLVWAIFLALAVVAPFTAGAQVGVSVNIRDSPAAARRRAGPSPQ